MGMIHKKSRTTRKRPRRTGKKSGQNTGTDFLALGLRVVLSLPRLGTDGGDRIQTGRNGEKCWQECSQKRGLAGVLEKMLARGMAASVWWSGLSLVEQSNGGMEWLGVWNGERKKTNKHKEFWRDIPLFFCPVCPVDMSHPSRHLSRLCRLSFCPDLCEFPHKSAQTSQVSLGRPEFIPGTFRPPISFM